MPRLGSWGLRIVRDVLGLAHLALGQCHVSVQLGKSLPWRESGRGEIKSQKTLVGPING
jgi:hypothetical protein